MNRHRTLIRLSAALAGVALVWACGGDSPTAPPTPEPARPATVTVSPATADLTALGATVQLTAEVRDQNAGVMAGATVTWSSSDTSAATVVASGLVTAVGNGTATITASAGTASGSAVVTVMQSVATVEVSPAPVDLTALGATVQLMAEAFDANGHAVAEAEFSWESSDNSVATVVGSGLVTAVGNGTATITASAGTASGSAVVTVSPSVATVEVSPSVADLTALGATVQLTAEAFDANGHAVAEAEFSWESSDNSVATVVGSGLVTAVGNGTATITASAGTAQGTAEITVVSQDRAALVALYEATGGPNWRRSGNWLTATPLGEWYGVNTNREGRVVGLSLIDNALDGPIPPELGNLTGLGLLSLIDNALRGPIPPELGNLASLEELRLYNNALSGPIPPELGNLASLKLLDMSDNALSGPIPPELGNLASLEWLSLGGNELCAPNDPRLRAWLLERRSYPPPCPRRPDALLLPRALIREDGNGVSLTLSDDFENLAAVTVSDARVVAATVSRDQSGLLREPVRLHIVPRGRGNAEVEVVPFGGGAPAIVEVVVRAGVGTFGIDIVMDQPVPLGYEEALTSAADWWSAVLDGTEWPDRKVADRRARPFCGFDGVTALVDELLIWAGTRDLGGTIGAQAHVCHEGAYPEFVVGAGTRVWVNTLTPHIAGDVDVMRHEIGHALGLILWPNHESWSTLEYVDGELGRYFVRPHAVEAFRAAGGDPNLPGVPMTRREGHWDIDCELMSPGTDWCGDGSGGLVVDEPDAISLAALRDAGYTVDISKATPWRPPNGAPVAAAGLIDVVITQRLGGEDPPR